MRVYMHCEGCSRKVKRCLQGFEGIKISFLQVKFACLVWILREIGIKMGFCVCVCLEGVEEVRTDCRNHKVVVKGKKAAEDPLKVVERVQKKTGRKVELLTPLPPPKPEKKEEAKKEEEKPKPEEKEEVISVASFSSC